jgi:predicted kinase
MQPLTLYLFVGYPGAGKTTVAKIIADNTHAVHLWADVERHNMFSQPTHSNQESHQLYENLNEKADQLLGAGKSVVFDTNFNYQADRQKLRAIAAKNRARTVLIWITTPVEVARSRAVTAHQTRNLYPINMSEEEFNEIVSKLEPPTEAEQAVKIDCSDVNPESVISILGLK